MISISFLKVSILFMTSGCVLLIVYIYVNCFSQSSDELLTVIQIFRHGQRMPFLFYPNDPYANVSYWNTRPSHLTKEGVLQAYDLGEYTRTRYNQFLPSVYCDKDFQIYSTNTSRTISSAKAFLSGLYTQRVESFETVGNLIPITIAKKSFYTEECLLYSELLNTTRMERLDELEASLGKEIMEYIYVHSGVNTRSAFRASAVSDTLDVENDAGFQLPKWTQIVFPEPLKRFHFSYIHGRLPSKLLRQLHVGTFLNSLIEEFGHPSQSKKLTAYSVHDLDLIGLLSTFGHDFKPMFSSSIFIELWRRSKFKYINVYFKNGNTLFPIQINCCEFNCDLESFKYLVGDYIIDEETFHDKCGFIDNK